MQFVDQLFLNMGELKNFAEAIENLQIITKTTQI